MLERPIETMAVLKCRLPRVANAQLIPSDTLPRTMPETQPSHQGAPRLRLLEQELAAAGTVERDGIEAKLSRLVAHETELSNGQNGLSCCGGNRTLED